MRLTSHDARNIANRAGVDITTDFHALTSDQVNRLRIEADARGYRTYRNAPGSRLRMFWQYVQRTARGRT